LDGILGFVILINNLLHGVRREETSTGEGDLRLGRLRPQTRRKSNGAESRRGNSRTGSNDKITTPNPGGIQLSVTVREHGGILFKWMMHVYALF
jgi:hypothetical protein